MGTGARTLFRSLGASALLALAFAGLLGYGGLQEAERCCPKAPLDEASGRVGLVTYRMESGGRYKGFTAGRVLEIRISGNRNWFVYDDDWPHIDTLRRAIRRGERIRIGYANCRQPLTRTSRCDAFEVALGDGMVLTTAREVIADRARHARALIWLAGLAAAAGMLFAVLWGYGVSRGTEARVAS